MEFLRLLNQYVWGTHADRKLLRLRSTVRKINAEEIALQKLTDEELTAKTEEFRNRISAGENPDHLLVEAFAAVKNACRRMCGTKLTVCGIETVWDMIPYDVQILAGIVLHRSGIAEMATGEGKTLAAAMPLYLNALCGKGAHLVTVNDYLALRDSEWIGSIFRYLGLTVGCIQTGQSPEERKAAYACDITYGMNSEFGFDYLRDNGMAMSREEMVQRDLFFAIIDEIDSVLIDEARVPLIIAGEEEVPLDQYERFKTIIRKLTEAQKKRIDSFLHDAAELLRNDGTAEEGIRLLFLARLGMPRYRPLHKILEDSNLRMQLDRYEDRMRQMLAATQFSELKTNLYFIVDEKYGQIELTARGLEFFEHLQENLFVLPDLEKQIAALRNDETAGEPEKKKRIEKARENYRLQVESIHDFRQLMQAYCLFEKDIHYIVESGKILIVDEHTGRALPGRRFSNGLHQALEAKEEVRIESENITYASITQQNYFRLYKKLAGMTGTASTEASEFFRTYKLEVTPIPTNRPVHRRLHEDQVFRTRREKFHAIADEVARRFEAGQPVLLGTPSVEDSETISRILRMKKLPHQVLNAKQNRQEAEIVACAGQKGKITVATNMAGRGTDIRLGPGVVELGGLFVLGSSRHEARRIDLQLQGRCARQGDPGESAFYVSLEDDFMRLYGPENAVKIFAGNEEPSISCKRLDSIIEKAQKKLEMHHYAIRKRTLEYDDVMNKHRTVIYSIRRSILCDDNAEKVLDEILLRRADFWIGSRSRENDETASDSRLSAIIFEESGIRIPDSEWKESGRDPAEVIAEHLKTQFPASLDELDEPQKNRMVRALLLQAIEREWVSHLNAMEHLVDNIYLVSYGQKDPLVEYKKEAYILFERLMDSIDEGVVSALFRSAPVSARFSNGQDQLVRKNLKK
ncbi:MAG: preprotein translocase subunit SecA [Lentisphaerae bacterium ADurb.Bin242]|nr:MAG: preprotein translocase subunit SecA [Lentisphaerae bacterium ADurb.Bin242]